MNIALVTDSTADIPSDLLRTRRIHVIPNLVIIGNQELVDGVDITREEFYTRLPGMKDHPTTATSSSGSYEKLFSELLAQGANHILSIHASSLLTGIFNAASAAAQSFKGQVHVIDSEQLSMGLGFQVLAAAESIAGGAQLEEVIDAITDIRRRIHVAAMLDTLEFVRRSGRVSWARARLGNILRVKPFVEVRAGQVYSLGETRTRSKGIRRLRDFLLELGPLEKLAILHTNAEDDARQFLASLPTAFTPSPPIVNVTTVIGVHVGPNGLGFAAVTQ